MREIVDVHFPNLQADLVDEALKVFYGLREVKGLKKPPSTSELVDWISLLMADELGKGENMAVKQLSEPTESLPPFAGALLKNENDVSLLERLGFMLRLNR
jgi:MoxR-like ATPase